jgi:hypothetical protein
VRKYLLSIVNAFSESKPYLTTDEGSTFFNFWMEKRELATAIISVTKKRNPRNCGERLMISPALAIPSLVMISRNNETANPTTA